MSAAEGERDFVRSSWRSETFSDVIVVITAKRPEVKESYEAHDAHDVAGAPPQAQEQAHADGQHSSPAEQPGTTVRVPCVRFELAKASLTFRAQLERWAGNGSAQSSGGGGGAELVTWVEPEDIPAMQQLLDFIHTRELPPDLPAEELCRLLLLAHFHAVPSAQAAASSALLPLAAGLPGPRCAALFAALHPLAEGGGAVAQAAGTCLLRLRGLLSPLEGVFLDEGGLGALFDGLPLAAAAAITKPRLTEWASQETAFLASLRWLDANACSLGAEAAAEAADHLFGQLEFSQMDPSLLLAAAQSSAAFHTWRGAAAAAAAAGFACVAHATQLGSSWRSQVAPGCPGMHAEVPPHPQPLSLDLAVPLDWFLQEAGRLQRACAAVQQQRKEHQAAPAASGTQAASSRPQIQERLFSEHQGETVLYRGLSWRPSLVLGMQLTPTRDHRQWHAVAAPPPLQVVPGRFAAQEAGGGRGDLYWPAQPARPRLVAHLRLTAQSVLAVGAEASSGGDTGSCTDEASALASGLGPIVRAAFFAGSHCPLSGDIVWTEQATSRQAPTLLGGAYGGAQGCPGLTCVLDAFGDRPRGEPAHTLPNLASSAIGGTMRYRIVLEVEPSFGRSGGMAGSHPLTAQP